MEIARERPATSLGVQERSIEAEVQPRLFPLLATSTTERCNICSQNLRACVEFVRRAANSHTNLSEKLRLRALENRLDEHRIRFDIWRSDCAVAEGWLSAINDGQEAGLHKLVDALFVRLNNSFSTLLQPISQIKQCNESAGNSVLFDQFDEAERQILAVCDDLTEQFHKLVELQPSIQMAQAIHLNQGPYASLRQGIVQIGSKYRNHEKAIDEISESAGEDTASQTSGDERCPECSQRVPYHALAFHGDSCPGIMLSDNAELSSKTLAQLDGEGSLSTEKTLQAPPDSVSAYEMRGDAPEMGGGGPKLPMSPLFSRSTASTVFPLPTPRREKFVGQATAAGPSSSYGGDTVLDNIYREDEGITSHENMNQADITPYMYAHAVHNHSEQNTRNSLYPGDSWRPLAAYLLEGLKLSSKVPVTSWRLAKRPMATLHTYFPMEDTRTTVDIQNPWEATELLQDEKAKSQVNLLFLGGNPSAQWLVNIGSACRLDPEFLRRHLTSDLGDPDFTLPSLPSTSGNMIRLRYTTIAMRHAGGKLQGLRGILDEKLAPGKRDKGMSVDTTKVPNFAADLEHAEVNRSRYYGEASPLYHPDLNPKKNIGGSVIRTRSVHDHHYMSIEQDISICVKRKRGGPGWLAFIWLDCGNNLESNTEFIPTVQYPHNFTLKGRPYFSSDRYSNQNAQLLQQQYGIDLDARVVSVDAFYALHGLFRFTAFSEAQFLNLMDAQLKKESSPASVVSRRAMLNNFRNNHSILRRHTEQLQETIKVIQERGSPQWPKAKNGYAKRKATTAADQLESDFYYLRHRAEYLANGYSEAIAAIQSKLLLQQSQRNAILIRTVLIMLLFIFTTSFFSMNFKEFGVGTLHLWIYPAVALPLFILSLFAVAMGKTVQHSVYNYCAELWMTTFGDRLRSQARDQNKWQSEVGPTQQNQAWRTATYFDPAPDP